MVSIKKIREMALSFPDTLEQPHFEKRAFKVNKKRIFCTLSEKDMTAVVRLSETDQSVYCQMDPEMIHPVPNKWGKQGWTIISLKKINTKLLGEILGVAYREIK